MDKNQPPSKDQAEETPEPKTVRLAKATQVGRRLLIDPDTIIEVTDGGDDDPRSF